MEPVAEELLWTGGVGWSAEALRLSMGPQGPMEFVVALLNFMGP